MPTYTPAQVKEKSHVAGIASESNENLEKLILEAEPLIGSALRVLGESRRRALFISSL